MTISSLPIDKKLAWSIGLFPIRGHLSFTKNWNDSEDLFIVYLTWFKSRYFYFRFSEFSTSSCSKASRPSSRWPWGSSRWPGRISCSRTSRVWWSTSGSTFPRPIAARRTPSTWWPWRALSNSRSWTRWVLRISLWRKHLSYEKLSSWFRFLVCTCSRAL